MHLLCDASTSESLHGNIKKYHMYMLYLRSKGRKVELLYHNSSVTFHLLCGNITI